MVAGHEGGREDHPEGVRGALLPYRSGLPSKWHQIAFFDLPDINWSSPESGESGRFQNTCSSCEGWWREDLTPQVPKPEALPKLSPAWKVTSNSFKTILSF